MTKKESPAGKQGQEGHNKDTNSSGIRSTVRALFSSGKKLTAKEINQYTGSNDARKVISDLRREGWNIVDLVRADGSKLYWLPADIRQDELFPQEGNSYEQ